MTLLARVAPPILFGGRRAGLLIERNLLVYRRGWLVIVSGFFEPLFYLLSIGLGIGALVGTVTVDGQAIPYTAFVAPALLASSAMNGAIYDSTFNVFFKLNYAKTYDAILSTPVGVGDVALGEIGWALIRGGIYAAAFIVVMFALGMILSPWAVLAFPAALLVGFAFGAAGMAATSFMRTWQDFDLVQLVILPLFLFSATFYPITTYPEPIQRHRPAHAALPRGGPDSRPHDGQRRPGPAGPRGVPVRHGPDRPRDHVAAPGAAPAEVADPRRPDPRECAATRAPAAYARASALLPSSPCESTRRSTSTSILFARRPPPSAPRAPRTRSTRPSPKSSRVGGGQRSLACRCRT